MSVLLEEQDTFGQRSLLNLWTDLDTSRWQIAHDIPPLGMCSKGRVSDTSDEAWYLEQVVNLSKIGIWECVTGEAS